MTELWLFDAEWTNASLLVMLHFMWQATLVMLVAWGIASLGRSLGGRFQYRLWLCAYFSLPCFVLGTIVAVDLPAKLLRAIDAQRTAATTTDRDRAAGDRALLANGAVKSGHTRLTDPRIVEDPLVAARTNAPRSRPFADDEPIESRMVGQPVAPVVEPGNELAVATVEANSAAQNIQSSRGESSAWPYAAWIVFVYVCGVFLLLIRFVVGLAGVRRLARAPSSEQSSKLDGILNGLKTRFPEAARVQVRACQRVTVPAVLGLFQSTILVPANLLGQLSPEQLELILLHELMHIRRWDPWVNALQRMVEAFLFFHPAVWWMSRRLRVVREWACDEAVLEQGGDPGAYASSLLAVATYHHGRAQSDRQALGVSFADGSMSQLRRRIHQILGEPLDMKSRIYRSESWLIVVLLGAAMTGLMAVQSPNFAQTKPPSIPVEEEPNVGDPVAQDPTAEEPVAQNGEQGEVDSPEETWGEPDQGIAVRLVPVKPGSDEQVPDKAGMLAEAQYENCQTATFRVELKNVSDQPIQLCGVRYGENWTPPAPGRSNTNWYAPLFFDVDFFDMTGEPLGMATPELGQTDQRMLVSGVATPTLEPGEVVSYLLSPGKWNHGLETRLKQGNYRVVVTYRGVREGVKKDLPEVWQDRAFTTSWSGKAASNAVEIEIENEAPDAGPKVVWGEEMEGLRAGLVLSKDDDGYPFGKRVDVKFLVENTGDDTVVFWSETWRQDDGATLTRPGGEPKDFRGAWYSGMPVMVKWTLEPGQFALLTASQLGIARDKAQSEKLDHPVGRVIIGEAGEYRLQFELHFGRLQRQDGEGNVTVPGPKDWKGTLKTGEASFVIREPKPGDFPEPKRFDAKLELRGKDGDAIQAGVVKIWDRSSRSFEPIELPATSNSLLVEQITGQALAIDVRIPGYEEQRFYEQKFSAEAPTVLELRPTEPTTFRLLDAVTGMPIEGAKVRYFRRSSQNASAGPYPTHGLEGPVWATSDAQGQVTLDTLRKRDPGRSNMGNDLYHFYVEPPQGYAPRFVGPIGPGESLGDLTLSAPITVSGVIRGTPEELDEFDAEWDQPALIAGGIPHAQWTYAKSEDLETQRDGDVLRFTLKNLRPGKLRFVGRFEKGESSIGHAYSKREPTEDDWVFEFDIEGDRDDLVLSSKSPKGTGAGPQWRLFDSKQLKNVATRPHLVFVQVGAEWCLTGEMQHRKTLDTPATKALFEKHQVVAVRGDMTEPSEEIAAWLKEYGNKNATLPFYVLLAGPEVEPIVLPEVLTKDKLEEVVESAVEAMAAAK